MSAATCGTGLPGYRYAHPGYGTFTASPREPLRDLLLRIRAGLGVGADMAAVGRCRVGACGRCVQREVGPIEIVIGAGIDHDARERAAAVGAVHHLAAGRRR